MNLYIQKVIGPLSGNRPSVQFDINKWQESALFVSFLYRNDANQIVNY